MHNIDSNAQSVDSPTLEERLVRRVGRLFFMRSVALRAVISLLFLCLMPVLFIADVTSACGEDYRVTSTGSIMTIGQNCSLTLRDVSAQSTVKIKLLSKVPVDDAGDAHTAYLLNCDGISTLTIDGDFGKIYTEAPVGELSAQGSIKSITAKDCVISRFQALRISRIKIQASNSVLADRTVSLLKTIGEGPMRASFAGVVVENIDTHQDIVSLRIASKVGRDITSGANGRDITSGAKQISLGGVGLASRVEAMAWGGKNQPEENDSVVLAASILNFSATGCPVTPWKIEAGLSKIAMRAVSFSTSIGTLAPEANLVVPRLISSLPIKSISAKATQVRGLSYGGQIGLPLFPSAMRIQAQDDIQSLRAHGNIAVEIWAGFDLAGPTYTGNVQRIASKRGALRGKAYVATDSIRFAPQQGNFQVFTQPVLVSETEELIVSLPDGTLLPMMRIPAGEYQMGSPPEEIGRQNNESPQHRVSIGYDFYMSKYEITQSQWLAVMQKWPALFWPEADNGKGDTYPAYNLSWINCQDYITDLNAAMTAQGQPHNAFRLPSEAEWEYACRGGTSTRFFFGNSDKAPDRYSDGPAGTMSGDRTDYVWYYANNAPFGSKPVGTRRSNAFGLCDMAGNVAEWCQDSWTGDYWSVPSDGSAAEPVSSKRVVRGGAWSSSIEDCRSASRDSLRVDHYAANVGFRLVLPLSSTTGGTIRVNVTPNEAEWTLSGPSGFLNNGKAFSGDRSFYNVPPGAYTVDILSNLALPNHQVQEVTEGQTVEFNVSRKPEELTITLPGNVPMTFVRIPGGEILMGSLPSEVSRQANEGPAKDVTLPYDYYMARTELTQSQWLALMETWPRGAPSGIYGEGGDMPAYNLSWDDCQNYIAALNTHIAVSDQGPSRFRLPSEAEWELACRAGAQTRFFFGNSSGANDETADAPAGDMPGLRSDYVSFYQGLDSYGLALAGGKLPNAFGLYDMSGSVWEWCRDGYLDTYKDYPGNGTSPSPSTSYRAVRGGSAFGFFRDSRSASRRKTHVSQASFEIGMRPLWLLSSEYFGSISVQSTAEDGVWTIVGPAEFTENGVYFKGSKEITDVPPGEYTFVPLELPGHIKPAQETKSIIFGQQIQFDPVWVSTSIGVEEKTIFLPGGVPLVLVRIPSGSFSMGSQSGERGSSVKEGPSHVVQISEDFYLAKFELTQAQWFAVLQKWPWTEPTQRYGESDYYPAYSIGWNDCQDFVKALNAHITRTGQDVPSFRLPSEAEWEYACRAGTQTRFYFGDSLDGDDRFEDAPAGVMPGNRTDYVWYGGNNSTFGTKPVGALLPNFFGLYDMLGNVEEWCQDEWHSTYDGAPTDGSVWVDEHSTTTYVTRGGAWSYPLKDCRAAARFDRSTIYGSPFIGMRLAQTAAPAEINVISVNVSPSNARSRK